MIVPLALGLGYFFIGNFVFVPLVNAGQPVTYVYEYFAPLGTTMGEVVRTAIAHPIYTIETTYRTAKVVYLVLLFLPTAGLALLAPKELVFMLPLLGINFLATKPELTNIRYWYSMLLVGPLVVATIVGMRRVNDWLSRSGAAGVGLGAAGGAARPAWRSRSFSRATRCCRSGCTTSRRVGWRRRMRSWRWCRTARMWPRAAGSRRTCCASYLYYYPLADPTILPTIDVIIADVSSDSFDDPKSGAQLQAVRTSPEWKLVLDRDGYQVFERK